MTEPTTCPAEAMEQCGCSGHRSPDAPCPRQDHCCSFCEHCGRYLPRWVNIKAHRKECKRQVLVLAQAQAQAVARAAGADEVVLADGFKDSCRLLKKCSTGRRAAKAVRKDGLFFFSLSFPCKRESSTVIVVLKI